MANSGTYQRFPGVAGIVSLRPVVRYHLICHFGFRLYGSVLGAPNPIHAKANPNQMRTVFSRSRSGFASY